MRSRVCHPIAIVTHLALVLPLLCWLWQPCHAQDYEPSWSLEAFRGPVVGAADIVGRGGSCLAIAEGASSLFCQPAAVVNRNARNGGEFFDWDWTLDWLNVNLGDWTDVDNRGPSVFERGMDSLINASFSLNFGRFGIALSLYGSSFEVQCHEPSCDFASATASTINGGFVFGYALADGELMLATELSFPRTDISLVGNDGDANPKLALNTVQLNSGLLWRPQKEQFRVGLVARLPAHQEVISAQVENTPMLMPNRVLAPWELGVGAVYSFGPRRLNPRPSFGDERSWARDQYSAPMFREYWLIAADLLLFGASKHASSLAAWFEQTLQPAGRQLSLSLRLGAEAEFWPDVMRARIGSYWEPSRYDDIDGRLHVTTSVDLHLPDFIWPWRFTAGADLAPNYFNLLLSLGLWH
ncbi:MAG: hypothetical protein RBU37_00110 [Myxococcota bacterium]|jgi:hypothetical protein|nr:hypothetical protein [Myxococcota bacterium]